MVDQNPVTRDELQRFLYGEHPLHEDGEESSPIIAFDDLGGYVPFTTIALADALLSEFVVLRKTEEQNCRVCGHGAEYHDRENGCIECRCPATSITSEQSEEPKLDPQPWKITNRASGAFVTSFPGTPDKEPWHFTHEAATFAPTDGYSQDPKDYGIEQEGGN